MNLMLSSIHSIYILCVIYMQILIDNKAWKLLHCYNLMKEAVYFSL